MAEKEGLVLLRKISSRPPAASHLRFAPSNPMVLISSFLPQFYGFALNGGEGGIGFAAQNLFETACGVPSALRCVEPDGSHLILLTAILRLRLKWRRRRDWFCCAKSLRDRLRRPICASLRRTRVVRISSFLPQFYGFALNGGEGGIGFAAQNLFETACGVPSALRSRRTSILIGASPLRSVEPSGSHLILLTAILRLRLKWRRRRDSNPRCHF